MVENPWKPIARMLFKVMLVSLTSYDINILAFVIWTFYTSFSDNELPMYCDKTAMLNK